jgi:hypothetical protein
VTAVAPFHKKKRDHGRCDNGHNGGNVTASSDRKASGLCRFYWKWGEDANSCPQALLMAGKLVRRGWMNAIASGRLVHIVGESSQRRFLVDIGAAYPIFPFSLARSPALVSWVQMDYTSLAGGSALVFHGRRFEWPFLLAEVQLPIIGVDFLRHFKLLVHE